MRRVTALASAARHLMTFGGGAMTVDGLEGEPLQAAIGAAVTLIGFGWSLWEKHAAEKPAPMPEPAPKPAARPKLNQSKRR
jgi:hypothetical protein